MHTPTLANIPEAPRLYLRRIARLYLIPFTQIILALLIVCLGLHLGLPASLLFPWAIFNISCICLLDLASPQSLIISIGFRLMHRLNRAQAWPAQIRNLRQVYSPYPPSTLVPYFPQLRWLLPAATFLASCILALLLPTQPDTIQWRSLYLLLLLNYGLIPFQQLCTSRPPKRPGRDIGFILTGYATIVAMGLISAYGFWRLHQDWWLTLAAASVVSALYGMIFLYQRLHIGEQVLSEVIREISLNLLAWQRPALALANIPTLIGSKLKHDHVFLLRPLPGAQELEVIGVYGDQAQLNQTVPIKNSITGTAFTECIPVVWNDVKACPYYHQVVGRQNAAEIAVPIQHQGRVFGVLDVQFGRPGVYGPGDCHALQTIASVLGNALALEQSAQFFQQALRLWEELTNAAGTTLSERAVFDLLADFTRQNLDVDVAIYYPLALTGYPVQEPYVAGDLQFPQLLKPPGNDPTDHLIQLITRWEPVFDADVHLLDSQTTQGERPAFAAREEIQAVCFVPVGTVQERLGALFLNFRHPAHFDTQFRFNILSLTQAAAKAIARIRYYHLFYQGFGRPDLNLHGILGRCGLKRADNFLKRAWTLHSTCPASCGCAADNCQLHELLSNIDRFLDEIRLAEYTIPPDFLKVSLADSVTAHRSSLPPRQNGRRPTIDVCIEPAIERESHWVKLILYRVIIEAVNNAVFHADAEQIQIEVRRLPHTVALSVANEGQPLLEVSQEKWSRHGIFALLHICRQELGADAAIAPTPSGTLVTLTLPMLSLL